MGGLFFIKLKETFTVTICLFSCLIGTQVYL